jgi:hypothetical protein
VCCPSIGGRYPAFRAGELITTSRAARLAQPHVQAGHEGPGTRAVQTTVTTTRRRQRKTSMVSAAQTQCRADASWPLLVTTQFTDYR